MLAAAVLLIAVVAIANIFISWKYKKLLFLIPLAVGLSGFFIDHFIKTDKEKIIDTIHSASEAIENENLKMLAELISDDYRDSAHYSKRHLLRRAEVFLDTSFVDKAVVTVNEPVIDVNSATAAVFARVLFNENSEIGQYMKQMFFEFELELHETTGQSWEIGRAELVEVNRQSAGWGKVRF